MKIFDAVGFSSKLTGSFSGSFIGDGSELIGTISSSISLTSSYIELSNVDGSASLSSRIFTNSASIASLETISGSYANSASFASDISTNASNISTNSASIASLETISGSYANSSSFASDISTNSASIGSLNAVSSSYLLNTTDTLTGDLTVTGNIIATTLNVQDVTASVIYSSGSNIFGSSSIDTQQFTGSILTSGSIEVNGDKFTVSGATGNATFAGDINLSGNAVYKNSGTLEIKAETISIKGVTTNENLAGFTENGAADLYYDNSKKFETTSTGISITGGGIFTDDVTINNGSPELYLTPAVNKYSWMIAAQENVDQHFEITPSTTVGGTTFNSPALKINGSDSSATFVGTITSRALSVGSSGTSRFTDTNAFPLQISRGLDVDVFGANGAYLSMGSIKAGSYVDAIRMSGGLAANGTDGTYTLQTLGGSSYTTALTINSSQDSTFAGNITFGDSHFIGDDASDNLLIQSSANENIIINSLDDTLFRNSGTTRLTIKDTLAQFTGTSYQLKFTTDDGSTQLGKLYDDTGFTLEGKLNNNLNLRSLANTTGEGIKFQNKTGGVLSTHMYISKDGNIGIAEDIPLVPLHISRDNASGENIALILDNNNTTAGNQIGMLFRSAVGGTNSDYEIFGVTNAANDMDLVFESDGSVERVRFTGDGNVHVGTRLAMKPSIMGYSSSYKALILGSSGTNYQTDSVTLCFGVDVSANPSGAFNGNGREYVFRNEGTFTTPNAVNNGYNSILNWSSAGKTSFSNFVGIGESDPDNRFVVRGSGSGFNSTLHPSVASIISNEMTDNAYHSILQLVAVRQSLVTGNASQGYLGFSTLDDSNNQGQLDAGRIAIVNEQVATRNSSTALSFWTNPGGTQTTAATEKMRINSAGFLKASNNGSYDNATSTVHELVSNSNGGQIAKFTHKGTVPYGMQIRYSQVSPNTTDNYFFIGSDSTANRIIIWGNGNVQNQNNSYGALSDIKLKENIVDATPKLDDLMKVKIRNFNLIGDDNKQIGVIAQEIEKVFPSLVEDVKEQESEETTKSVKYSVLVPIMLKAIQELKAEIEILKNK
ncbi:tail fiber domain-containing protein [bacterium]|nr:tail fiber domain-containing protein [bacterium]